MVSHREATVPEGLALSYSGVRSTSGFRAKSANRFLELPGGKIKVGFNLGGEMCVVLEPKPVGDDLQGEPLGDQAASEQHAVPPEQLLGAQPGSPLNSVFQLSVGKLQVFRNSRDRKLLFLSKLKQVLTVRTHEMLAVAADREFGRVWGHGNRTGRSFSWPDLKGHRQAN